MAEKRQIAIVLYPGMTALDALGPYEVLKLLPDSELRLVAHEVGPVVTDRDALIIGATHSLEETPIRSSCLFQARKPTPPPQWPMDDCSPG